MNTVENNLSPPQTISHETLNQQKIVHVLNLKLKNNLGGRCGIIAMQV